MLVDVLLVSLLGVSDGSQVRGKLPVGAINQTEAWTASGDAQGIVLSMLVSLLSAKRQPPRSLISYNYQPYCDILTLQGKL